MARRPADRTRLIAATTRRDGLRRPVNPPIERASTLLNGDPERMRDGTLGPVYGLDGMQAQQSLRAAIADLEGAAHCEITPSGLSAVTVALMASLRPGDTVLTTDALYGPSRRFLDRYLKRSGVTVRYHAADAATDEIIAALPGTKALLIESPASLTFEMVDVAALASAARAQAVTTIMDNTWASGLAFRPLEHGVDISVQALTKYASGHSDVLMGAICTAEGVHARSVAEVIEDQGWHVSPDDAWLVLRGLRTLPLRYGEHGRSALKVARWLHAHPAVDRVLYPPLPGSVGHTLWRRDYTGAPGLMGLVLRDADTEAVHRFMQALTFFGMGYSWGGFESLVTHEGPQLSHRLHPPQLNGALVRLHIGLEDPDDLIADLDQALKQVCGPHAS